MICHISHGDTVAIGRLIKGKPPSFFCATVYEEMLDTRINENNFEARRNP